MPHVKWTTGEHEYSRYGFRKLIEDRSVDILQVGTFTFDEWVGKLKHSQPDVMWLGGLTELLRVSAQAAAYDIPVVSLSLLSGGISADGIIDSVHTDPVPTRTTT
jgi:L-rhamnonate dehydratase